MATIVLARPPAVLPEMVIQTSQGTPALGTAYLSSSLKKAGHKVIVIDALGEGLDKFSRIKNTRLLVNGITATEIVDRIPLEADVIAVACMFSSDWIYTRQVINKIHEAFPNKPIITGGEHITADPEYSLRSVSRITACVLGEGETTVVELCEAILKQQPLHTIKGIAFLDGDRTYNKTAPRPRIGSVDDIPWPDWDNYPIEKYLDQGFGFNIARGRPMPMLASRGCPYQCTFCSSPLMWTTEWTARDQTDVVNEMKYYIDKYNIDHVEFYDLTSIIKKEWIVNFTKLLIKENINITWSLPSGTRSEALDEEVLALLKKSGCNKLTYAPEAGSATTLKRIKKKVKLPRMLKSIRWATKAGIRVKANLMFGIPGQTKYEIFETFGFLAKTAWLGMRDVSLFGFVPYPGSELFFKLLEDQKINDSIDEYEKFLLGNIYGDSGGMKSWSEHLSDSGLKATIYTAFFWFYGLSFLFRPHRLFSTIWRIIRSNPITTLDLLIDGTIKNIIRGRKRKIEKTIEIQRI